MSSVDTLSNFSLTSPASSYQQAGVSTSPAASAAAASSSLSPSQSTLTAGQGGKVVGAALNGAKSIQDSLNQLKDVLSAAADPNTAPKDQAATDAVNARIKTLASQIDSQVANAKVGNSNLLSKDSTGVTVATSSNQAVTVAGKALDTKSLGLSDIKVTDTQSARAALGQAFLALGKSQLAVFGLQTAAVTTGATAAASSSTSSTSVLDNVSKALGNQSAALSTDSTSAATSSSSGAGVTQATAADYLKQALDNQAAANALNYSNSGTTDYASSRGSIISLFA